MKAILEFQWPQEEEQFETAYLGHAYKELLKEYNTWLKWECKSTDDPNRAEILQQARDKMFEIMREFKLEIK